MKRLSFFRFLILIVFLFSCSSTIPEFNPPVENKCLLIGSVILDILGYRDINATIQANIEVAIIGNVIDGGQEKRVGFWVETDENGYFYLENVPPGKYALKGIRARSMDLNELTIVNELTDPQRNYFEIYFSDNIPMTGNLFDVSSKNRIVNFQNNLFSLHRNGIVEFKRLARVRDYKLSAGDIINLPPVPSYFLEKFPASGWSTFLDLQM